MLLIRRYLKMTQVFSPQLKGYLPIVIGGIERCVLYKGKRRPLFPRPRDPWPTAQVLGPDLPTNNNSKVSLLFKVLNDLSRKAAWGKPERWVW